MSAKVAANLQRFRMAVAAHDRENPPPHGPAWGIGLSHFDLERLGFDEGEVLWREPSPISIHVDQGQSANFRVLCDGDHADAEKDAFGYSDAELEAVTHAVGSG